MRLKDYCLHITDGEHCSVQDDVLGEYYLLSNKNIVNGDIVIGSDERRINKGTFEKINKRILLAENDVLISTVGTLGKTAVVKEPINYTFQRSVGIIKPDPKKVDSYYLKYLLDTDYYQQILIGSSSGAIQKCIFIDALNKLPIDLPDLNTQRRIASILSNLDKKITLNRSISANLEALAYQLYDYWFVQFDFPDTNGKPYKSSGGKMVYNEHLKREIPEGWTSTSLSNILDILKDGTHNPPRRCVTGVPLLTGTMFGDVFLDYKKATYISLEDYKEIHKKYQPHDDDIIITKIGTIGNVNILRKSDIPIAIHCNSALLRFKKMYCGPYALLFCKSKTFYSRLYASKGQSIQEFVGLDRIANVPVECPTQEVLVAFNNMLKPFIGQLERMQEEIASLNHQRDELLPLLMNGQVTI